MRKPANKFFFSWTLFIRIERVEYLERNENIFSCPFPPFFLHLKGIRAVSALISKRHGHFWFFLALTSFNWYFSNEAYLWISFTSLSTYYF